MIHVAASKTTTAPPIHGTSLEHATTVHLHYHARIFSPTQETTRIFGIVIGSIYAIVLVCVVASVDKEG